MDLYHVLGGGSSYTQFLMRMREHNKQETPPAAGGGGLLDQINGFVRNAKSGNEPLKLGSLKQC